MLDRLTADANAVAIRGQQIYDRKIRSLVEPGKTGNYVVIDVNSGEYEISLDREAALTNAENRMPNGTFYVVKVGNPAAVRLGCADATRLRQ